MVLIFIVDIDTFRLNLGMNLQNKLRCSTGSQLIAEIWFESMCFLALNFRTLLQDFGTIEDGFAWWEQR